MDFPVTLDESSHQPMWQQLFVGLREAILSGRLPHGHSLPSTRQLADLLKVSRDTVLRTYEQLVCLGYVNSKVGVGTVVSWKSSPIASNHPASTNLSFEIQESLEQSLSEYAKRLMRAPFGSNNLELLNHGAAPPDLLPLSQWRRALQHRNATLNGAELESLSEPFGYRPLREAIAGYIQRFKGIDCHADQLIVMAEATQLQDMLAKMLLDPGDGVVLENPGCSRLRALLLSYGARLHPIVVDENGMVTNELFRVSSNCKFAFVTPAHHVPTGAVMSLDRRRKLLAWAKQTDAFVIEDGADSDFRYGSQPVPPIHKLDDQDLVIYLYSFWKTLFPLTGIACLVIPPALVATFEKIASLSRHSIPIVEAIALSELINSGNLERHIRKTWSEYTKRRQALIFALAQNFKSSVTYFKESSGHHLLVRFAAGPTEEQLLVSAAETNLPMISTQDWYAEGAEPREFLIPFALLSTKDIANAVSEFARRVNTLAQQCHPTASSHSVTSEVLIHPSVSTTENLPIG